MSKKKLQTMLYSVAGVAAMLVLVVAVNVIASFSKQRLDLTADKLYTLSPGTRAILGKIDGKVQVRFYCTRGDKEMPVVLKTYAQRVEDLLNEMQQVSKGKLEIRKLDPEPDSDAEDSANLDGVEGQDLGNGEKVYLGLAINFADQKSAIPFLLPDREKLLEYDIARAISGVLTDKKPVIGVMSGLPVFGQQANPMMMQMGQQPEPAWTFISELQRDFDVQRVSLSADKIDDKIKVLLVVHPKGITDVSQYAIDQFILHGGRVIALVDPQCVVDRSNANPQMGGMGGGSSNLEKLFKAWGISMEGGRVVADMNYSSRIFRGGRPEQAPAFLSLVEGAINHDDVLTGPVDNILLPFAGAITGTPAAGLQETVLLKSSDNSAMVEGFLAQLSSEQVMKDFKSDSKEKALAVRLTGKFKTAFPDGKPKAAAPEEKEAEKKDEAKDAPPLKESQQDNSVIIVADSDWLYDQFCVQVQELLGQRLVIPRNGNLNLLQNMVEMQSGDSNLIEVRSRAVQNRQLTVVNKMQAKAEASFQEKIKEQEQSLAETQRRLSELQQSKDKGQRFILSPEQQKELENYRTKEAQTKKDLKQVKKDLKYEIDALQFRTKVANIFGMPLLVALCGIVMAVTKYKRTAAK